VFLEPHYSRLYKQHTISYNSLAAELLGSTPPLDTILTQFHPTSILTTYFPKMDTILSQFYPPLIVTRYRYRYIHTHAHTHPVHTLHYIQTHKIRYLNVFSLCLQRGFITQVFYTHPLPFQPVAASSISLGNTYKPPRYCHVELHMLNLLFNLRPNIF
jgi:hypothetical protein